MRGPSPSKTRRNWRKRRKSCLPTGSWRNNCPYLAPEPYRGTLNTPANVALVTKKLAELRGESVEKTAADIKRNAHALFYKMNRG
ncbi:MAG: TatD family hydrolase [Candidatus Borkfalkia sp.]